LFFTTRTVNWTSVKSDARAKAFAVALLRVAVSEIEIRAFVIHGKIALPR
jgi:hypothetical protein